MEKSELMDLYRMAMAAGLPGTPGGPVRESPLMTQERMMQMAPNLAATGLGMYGVGTFNPALAFGGGVGYLLSKDAWDNAQEPNIRDVWTDKIRMRQQGR
jgi:malate synthase